MLFILKNGASSGLLLGDKMLRLAGTFVPPCGVVLKIEPVWPCPGQPSFNRLVINLIKGS